MATYYRTGVETYSIIGTADEKDSLEGRIPDGSTYIAVDENMFYTFYDGQWYETLPEAARLYHDDVGTDTKPIKLVGGVATVVANELAEDSKVVHKTGDETVGGIKTLTSRLVQKHSAPTYWMVSTADYQDNVWKGYIRTSDQKDSVSTIHSDIIAQTEATNNSVRFAVYTPDRSAHYDMSVRTFSDHQIVQVVPYYPVDGSSNPQVLPAYALMASGSIAVDPRIVHTTGNETIVGTKTFSASTVINRLERGYTLTVIRASEWAKLYEFPPATYGANIVFRIINYWTLTQFVGGEVRVGVSNSPDYQLIGLMYGVGNILKGKVARRADNTIEVWVQNTLGNGIDISTEIIGQRSTTPKPIGQIGTMPAVGDTYVDVVDMTIVS